MDDGNVGTPLTPREFVMEKEQFKGYVTEYEFGWVWEIERDDEYYHKGAALSGPTAARNIKSMINVFLRLKENDVEKDT